MITSCPRFFYRYLAPVSVTAPLCVFIIPFEKVCVPSKPFLHLYYGTVSELPIKDKLFFSVTHCIAILQGYLWHYSINFSYKNVRSSFYHYVRRKCWNTEAHNNKLLTIAGCKRTISDDFINLNEDALEISLKRHEITRKILQKYKRSSAAR